MRMKIAVPDAERGFVLAGQLARYGAEVVAHDGKGGNNVALDEPSSQELPTVLALIERWIEDEHVDVARVELDGRAYTMELNTTH